MCFNALNPTTLLRFGILKNKELPFQNIAQEMKKELGSLP